MFLKCFSSKIIIVAVEENISGAFSKGFQVIASNNISVECGFWFVCLVFVFFNEHSKILSLKHSLDWACELEYNSYL